MAHVLLDTTVLIDILRGRPAIERLRRLRAAGDAPWICAINVEEIARGVRAGDEPGARRLLDGLRRVPLRDAEAWQAGSWRRDFGAQGITVAQADCLIAAAALSLGGRLATGNPRHFPMPELTVEHWPVGA